MVPSASVGVGRGRRFARLGRNHKIKVESQRFALRSQGNLLPQEIHDSGDVMSHAVVFGEADDRTRAQLARCLEAEPGALGVLCADNHLGYAMPWAASSATGTMFRRTVSATTSRVVTAPCGRILSREMSTCAA